MDQLSPLSYFRSAKIQIEWIYPYNGLCLNLSISNFATYFSQYICKGWLQPIGCFLETLAANCQRPNGRRNCNVHSTRITGLSWQRNLLWLRDVGHLESSGLWKVNAQALSVRGGLPSSQSRFIWNVSTLSPCCQNAMAGTSRATPGLVYAQKYMVEWNKCREIVANAIHVNMSDRVFVMNATTGVDEMLRSLPWKAGDSILYYSTAYGSSRSLLSWIRCLWENCAVFMRYDSEIPISEAGTRLSDFRWPNPGLDRDSPSQRPYNQIGYDGCFVVASRGHFPLWAGLSCLSSVRHLQSRWRGTCRNSNPSGFVSESAWFLCIELTQMELRSKRMRSALCSFIPAAVDPEYSNRTWLCQFHSTVRSKSD